MFVTKHCFIAIFVFVLFESYYSKSIRDDKYFDLFVVNPTTERAPVADNKIAVTNAPAYDVPKTTYDWGQWTKTQAPGSRTTYDWGQHTATGTTYDWGQHTATGTQAPGSRTTYDWGQHTGSRTTYDWGQHTATGTQAPGSKTTYDWGQWTSTAAPGSRTTYDWGQHTATGTTYDWGQHTGSRTTYDWGQHTSTSSPNEDNSTVTDNPNEYRCPAGKYTCKGTIGLCISLTQICDGKQDCPHRDDENPKVCFPGFGGDKSKKKNVNNFSGTGFMFHIRNIVVKEGSDAKLFNQQSDNRNTNIIQN